jgi:hypothetical protein
MAAPTIAARSVVESIARTPVGWRTAPVPRLARPDSVLAVAIRRPPVLMAGYDPSR